MQRNINISFSPSDTLVCWLKRKSDLFILLNEGWYRIPVRTKLENLYKVKYLAFYQSYSFGKSAFLINHYGAIKKIEIAKRITLLPKEKHNPNRNEDYYKISLKDMNILEKPIRAKRQRRIIFINTTLKKLLSAEELNDLYNDSPLEDIVWNGLKKNNISAERQFFVNQGKKIYCFDFAAFCRKGNVDIECDGDSYHINKEKAVSDNKRDNFLTKKGWSILRYSTSQIRNIDECISEISECIRSKGGIYY